MGYEKTRLSGKGLGSVWYGSGKGSDYDVGKGGRVVVWGMVGNVESMGRTG